MPDLRPSEQITKPFTVRVPTAVKARLRALEATKGRGWYAPFVRQFLVHLLKAVDGNNPQPPSSDE